MFSKSLLLARNVQTSISRVLSTQLWQQPEGFDTGIKIYNNIIQKDVPLVLKNEKFATWYTCGPTVYDSAHIGHASCYVKLDIIQRILRDYFKINVITAMNITDIDDKLIKKSQEIGVTCQELAKKHEEEFWADLNNLGVQEPDIKLRVTDHISDIVVFIEKIIDKEVGYIGKDNSVYFKVESCPNYGKLQKLNLETTEHDIKDSALDFALWKASKEFEPFWDSPWGPGRPGWHIECSTLASKLFGNAVDFHAGGMDLRFPHHENEEAQCCVYHDTEQWVNYWLHTGHLNLENETVKMSKSLKNTISVGEFLSNYTSDEFRMACLLSNYRTSMKFSFEMMHTAKNTLKKFLQFDLDCQAYLEGKKNSEIDNSVILEKLTATEKAVDEALRNDFDTAKVSTYLIDLMANISRYVNKELKFPGDNYTASSVDVIGAAKNYANNLFKTFGFQHGSKVPIAFENQVNIHSLLDDIVVLRSSIRNKAVANKDTGLFQICDEIRDCLRKKGVEIKDHSKGTSWKFMMDK